MPYTSNPVDGEPVYYEIEGAGPDLVLYCGFGATLDFWRPSYTGGLAG